MADTRLIQQVRVLIADVDHPPLLDTDTLDTYLSLNAGNVRLASADALEAIAVSELLVSKKIRTQDLTTDGPAVAAELRALAKTYREQATQADAADVFDVVDTIQAGSTRPEHTNYEVWGL